MKRARLEDRIDRLTTVHHTRQVWAAAEDVAARFTLTPQEVINEAYRLLDEARHRGITPIEVVASEWGICVDDVRADLAQLQLVIWITA